LAISWGAVGASPHYPGWFASEVPNNYFFGELCSAIKVIRIYNLILYEVMKVFFWHGRHTFFRIMANSKNILIIA
jgi:hypothetical protein